MRVFVLLLVLLCGAHAGADSIEALEALSADISRFLGEHDASFARAQAKDRQREAEIARLVQEVSLYEERLRKQLLRNDRFLLRYALSNCDDAMDTFSFVRLCVGTEHETLAPAVFMTRGEWTRECLSSFVRCNDDTGILREVLHKLRFEFDPWMRESEDTWPPQCAL